MKTSIRSRVLSCCMAFLLGFTLFGTTALPALAGEVVSSFASTRATDSWQTIGTCEWMIDEKGCLTIRPIDGVSGTFGLSGDSSSNVPWYDFRSSIKSVVIEDGVSAEGSLAYMFYYCSSLTSLDLSGFDTSSVTYMSYMFFGCSSLTSLDLSGFDTSNVTDMYDMFSDCSSLTSLDLSGFDTSSVGCMTSNVLPLLLAYLS